MKVQLMPADAALWSCQETSPDPCDSPWSQLAQVELLERALRKLPTSVRRSRMNERNGEKG